MKAKWRRELPLHVMILPGLILIVLFSYIPMAGITIAFQRFIPAKGLFGDQQWVGWDNFEYVMSLPNFTQVLWNTLFISSFKLILGLIVPIVFAVLLNELKNNVIKRSVQTAIYLPYFLSWVVLGGILIDILSPSGGIVNGFLGLLGIPKIFSWAITNGFRSRSSPPTYGKTSGTARLFTWLRLPELIRGYTKRQRSTVLTVGVKYGILRFRACAW